LDWFERITPATEETNPEKSKNDLHMIKDDFSRKLIELSKKKGLVLYHFNG
jgi:hypothetical protein